MGNPMCYAKFQVASHHASTVGTAGSKKSAKSMALLNNAVRHATDGFIGILDMFGFEDGKPSKLEQVDKISFIFQKKIFDKFNKVMHLWHWTQEMSIFSLPFLLCSIVIYIRTLTIFIQKFLFQLCINLCAETMQHFYNTHIFKSSVESCREEGIQLDVSVEYVDNVPVIDLISSLVSQRSF